MVIGFGYLQMTVDQFFKLQKPTSITIPKWAAAGGAREFQLHFDGVKQPNFQQLNTLFQTENKYVKQLLDLSDDLTKLKASQPVPMTKLSNDMMQFVQMASELDMWVPNAFFAVFDKLVRQASQGVSQSKSALILAITPTGGETVTKVIMAPPSVAEQINEDGPVNPESAVAAAKGGN